MIVIDPTTSFNILRRGQYKIPTLKCPSNYT